MKKLFLVVFLLFSFSVSAIELTEIMYNPTDGNEWVEIYTDTEINLSKYYFMDNYQKDTLTCCGHQKCNLSVPENNFFLLLDQSNTFSKQNNSLYFCVDDNELGNGLGNKGDKIMLIKGNKTVINQTYSLNVEKGKSISLINGSWVVTEPTPLGFFIENKEKPSEPKIALEFILPPKIFTEVIYLSPFKIKKLNYPENKEKVNVSLYKNLTAINTSFFWEDVSQHTFISYTTKTGTINISVSGEYVICGELFFKNSSLRYCQNISAIESRNIPCHVFLEMETDKIIYGQGETISIINKISNETFPFQIEYWVEDLFGNVVKNKRITQNTNTKKFTPNFDKLEKVFIVKSNLTTAICNNSNNNTVQEKIVVFKGIKENKSKIEILNVYSVSNEIVFGTPIKSRVSVYKGDTSKNSIKAYVENDGERVSYTTYFNIYETFRTHDITLPIQLKEDCKYESGTYTLFVEGLDVKTQVGVDIDNIVECVTEEEKNKAHPEVQLLAYSGNITGNIVFSVIEIFNKENYPLNYSVWSYVFRGPKSYPAEREANKKTLVVLNNTNKIIILENDLLEIDEGEYKIKIKLKKQGRKTPFEITKTLNVIQKKEDNDLNGEKDNMNNTNPITSNVIYESSSEKSKNILPGLIIGVGCLIVFAIIKLKKIR